MSHEHVAEPKWWMRYLDQRFLHCALLGHSVQGWVFCEWTARQMFAYPLTHEQAVQLLTVAYDENIVCLKYEPRMGNASWFNVTAAYCVSVAKQLLCISDVNILTCRQLHDALLARGARVIGEFDGCDSFDIRGRRVEDTAT